MDAPPRAASGTRLDVDNPWPGLDSYDEAAREFFSGRGAEAEELQRRILDEPMTVLFGKSGLGKTSLLKAGVFPGLREKGFLPVLLRLQLRPDTERLIEQVRLALSEALRTHEIDHPPLRDGETLWEYLHRSGLEFWTKQNRLVRPVFVFDQFEELFTLGRLIPAEVAAFREDLADLAENRIPAEVAESDLDAQAMPYKIVIALREDFLADLEGWRLTIPSLRRNRMRLLPMGPEQALQAVWNERTNHLVTEPLARKVVAFLSTGAAATNVGGSSEDVGATVEPALLSLFCQGVNEHRKREGKARFDEALLEGAKESIVMDFYRGSLRDQPDRVRRFIEENLVTEHGFRNSYSVDDAVAHGFVTSAELAALINRHLLRHEHHLGTARVELTHDLLTRAVIEERDGRRRAERDARESKRRRRLMVFAGSCAAVAVVLLGVAVYGDQQRRTAENLLVVTKKQQKDLATANETAVTEAGNARTQADINKGLAIEAGELATEAEKQATEAKKQATEAKKQKDLADAARKRADAASERARSKELAALAETLVSRSPERAVLLALEGLHQAPTLEARRVLLTAAQYSWPTVILDKEQVGGTPRVVALSADGERLAVLATNGDKSCAKAGSPTLTLWDMRPGRSSLVWCQEVAASPSLAFSPDRTLLAVVGDASIELRDATTTGAIVRRVGPRELRDESGPPRRGAVKSVGFSPDGRWLVWAESDKIHLLEYRNEQAKVVTAAAAVPPEIFVMAPDNSRIITVSTNLAAHSIDRTPEGTWSAPVLLKLGECMKPQSVSAGAQYVSATWKARACSSSAMSKDAGNFSERLGNLEGTSDILWSAAGNAFAEILLSHDLIIGRSDRFAGQSGSRIKGAIRETANNMMPLISINEPGTRVALIDRGREVRVYFLADYKPLLSRLERDRLAVAPDGSWVAVARRPLRGEQSAAIDVISLDLAFPAGFQPQVRKLTQIPAEGPQARVAILAAQSSVIVVRGRGTLGVTTAVYDAAKGEQRFDPKEGNPTALGAERELLLVAPPPRSPSPWKVVRTRDWSELAPWEQIPGGSGRLAFVVSPGNTALAVLRGLTAANPKEAEAIVYSVRGDNLVLSGRVIGLSAGLLSIPEQLQLADNARSLTEKRLPIGAQGLRKFVWSVTSGRQPTAGPIPRPVETTVASVSPSGRFETRTELGAEGNVRGLSVRKRGDDKILRELRGALLDSRFSGDDRWLAVWNWSGVQVLDLVHGETAWTWSPDGAQILDLAPGGNTRQVQPTVVGVEFEARNTMLKVHLSDSITILPLDRGLIERFAKWLVPRGLTRNECVRYGIDSEACRKMIATADAEHAE